MIENLERLRTALHGELSEALSEHITRRELRTLVRRVEHLLDGGCYPEPSGHGPAIPWPAF